MRTRHLRLRLEVGGATSTTTITDPDGSVVATSMHVDYRPTTHGLRRWTDPVDGHAYVVGSGALDGAAHFVAGTDGPSDRMPTEVTIETLAADDIVRATSGDVASHHLGLVAGPWRVFTRSGIEVLSQRTLKDPAGVSTLVDDTRAALDWMLDWFGVDGAPPWGEVYTQVLLPGAPWLAMEHPGCVLVSERLLDADRGQRVAVLAHEAAHQWLGNLVSPGTWRDVGAFEGLAELLGQLACEALAGESAPWTLMRRRSVGRLAVPPTVDDLRTMAATAGLAEVAGPVQHAELFRGAMAELGRVEFRTRLRDLVRRHATRTCSVADLWRGLGLEVRQVPTVRLPVVGEVGSSQWRDALRGCDRLDPATAAFAARRAFRTCGSGSERVREALAAMADPSTSYPVAAGLAAELSRTVAQKFQLV